MGWHDEEDDWWPDWATGPVMWTGCLMVAALPAGSLYRLVECNAARCAPGCDARNLSRFARPDGRGDQAMVCSIGRYLCLANRPARKKFTPRQKPDQHEVTGYLKVRFGRGDRRGQGKSAGPMGAHRRPTADASRCRRTPARRRRELIRRSPQRITPTTRERQEGYRGPGSRQVARTAMGGAYEPGRQDLGWGRPEVASAFSAIG